MFNEFKNDQIDSRINEVEVNQLLKNTIEVSSKVKNLMERLTKLDKKLRGHDKDTLVATNRKVYPNLYKLMNKNESGDKGKHWMMMMMSKKKKKLLLFQMKIILIQIMMIQ